LEDFWEGDFLSWPGEVGITGIGRGGGGGKRRGGRKGSSIVEGPLHWGYACVSQRQNRQSQNSNMKLLGTIIKISIKDRPRGKRKKNLVSGMF